MFLPELMSQHVAFVNSLVRPRAALHDLILCLTGSKIIFTV